MNNKIICLLCKNKFHKISSNHLKYCSDYTIVEYKNKFPDAKLTSDDFRSRISKSLMGHKVLKETRDKLKTKITILMKDPEYVKMISETTKDGMNKPEIKQKMKNAKFGAKLSLEHIENIRQSAKIVANSLEMLEKQKVARNRPETIEKRRLSMNKPEYIKNRRDNAIRQNNDPDSNFGKGWKIHRKESYPEKFRLKVSFYTPDFYLKDLKEYVEVKGYWETEAKKKFEEFKILYPEKIIRVVDATQIKELEKKLNLIGS